MFPWRWLTWLWTWRPWEAGRQIGRGRDHNIFNPKSNKLFKSYSYNTNPSSHSKSPNHNNQSQQTTTTTDHSHQPQQPCTTTNHNKQPQQATTTTKHHNPLQPTPVQRAVLLSRLGTRRFHPRQRRSLLESLVTVVMMDIEEDIDDNLELYKN